ncbi:hypothetical protein RHGRI_018057 [Rhododendron griersonianum]|uniref:Pentatricopeptide repeat-containing protein n=1 Tax=Rhododendron griersonianum TaxID=479676 RepID=A0AAV6K047_9ERIC|nr:hypothetical protein RHGRI_018057 [Rhododendron griersonianum]
MLNSHRLCRPFSSLIDQQKKDSNLVKFKIPGKLGGRNLNPIPLPHRTILDPRGQDLDYVNVAHSHLVHSDWAKLDKLAPNLTPFRVKHILLKIQMDYVLSLEFFTWVEAQNPNLHTLDTRSIILHILTKSSKFKSAESILKKILDSGSIHLPSKLFESILNSYRLCDSSSLVFDSLFKTYAHMRKLRNATDTFCQMKDYGFLPTVESCNAYLNTFKMLISTFCMNEDFDGAVQVVREMLERSMSPDSAILSELCHRLRQCGREKLVMELCKDIEARRLMPEGFEESRGILA